MTATHTTGLPEPLDPQITWERTCALLRGLALDVRSVRKPLEQITPRDLLPRATRVVNGRRVDQSFYAFSLSFNVSAQACGTIPIDDAEALAEFDRAVGAALASDLTKAEAERWALDCRRRDIERSDGVCDESEAVLALQREASSRAFARYERLRDRPGSRLTHEAIIEALLAEEGYEH